ncbi:Spc98 family-domain-containing protein [Cerioporus squamosus]|nr:Spc98 family-domain-containing protein [Cerioporus squamosus]
MGTSLTLDSAAAGDEAGPTICALPELRPQFFIPRLEEKPQNPIMDTLRFWQNRSRPQDNYMEQSRILPPELQLLSEDVLKFEQAKKDHLESIWTRAALRRHGSMNQVLSWDALRSSFNANVAPSPFLSEQSSKTFASARYHVRPPIYDPDVQLVYVHVPDLFRSLLLTVSGTSSHLHIWDPAHQKFVIRGLQGRKDGQIVIVGKDEVMSASLLKRFLTIGNLMRRLELVTDTPESRHFSNRHTSILHAFTHAISSILAYLRQTAETIHPELHAFPGADARLTALWTQYEDMEYILLALAALCSREEHVEPPDYEAIPATPEDLLSVIYRHLADHIERSSPRVVTAMLAFMLTTTSRSYFHTLCASVGYTTPSTHFRPALAKGRTRQDERDRMDSGLVDDEDNIVAHVNDDEPEGDGFPGFITAEMAEVFSRARKSLVLLRAADPEHPLLTGKHLHPEIEWLWTEEGLENMEDGLAFGGPTPKPRTNTAADKDSTCASWPTDPEDVMRAFKVFDLLPGEADSPSHSVATLNATGLLSGTQSTSTLRAFLTSFPPTLPVSTPTIAHLTARVLSPLITHAQTLSGALVARFLTPSTHLHLHTHLVLLRGYILITAHQFKSRLQAALFYDAEDVDAAVVGSRTYAASEARENARRERQMATTASGQNGSHGRSANGATQDARGNKESAKEKKMRRAIGLSPSLIIGDKWPPLGSDLNFLLRTVIVDALEEGRAYREEDDEELDEVAAAQNRIVEEAGWRLGFAIRDLPLATGREKWLNPLSIEALDFLYMHYQPPSPLDVLITPAILSKYHRMFAFNLRLMRVENVVRTLFRLTRKASAPLFPTLTPSNKLLLHFRFIAHSFVMALSSYVYDIAIGSNMDGFLARLAAASGSDPHSGYRHAGLAASTSPDSPVHERAAFADVFSLAEFHSRVLDDILSSCLLRSGQKAVGDILRGCMELVLELGVLVGEIRDGNLEEYEAGPMLEELWGRFRAKMTTFVKVLKALVEKEADASGLVLSDIPLHMMQGHRRVSGTTANLHQLLLRLNMSDWWTRKDSPRPA